MVASLTRTLNFGSRLRATASVSHGERKARVDVSHHTAAWSVGIAEKRTMLAVRGLAPAGSAGGGPENKCTPHIKGMSVTACGPYHPRC